MQRFWLIKRDDRYYSDARPDQPWTPDRLAALRFPCEDSALTFMVCNLDGKGHAVEIEAPALVA